MPSSTRRWASWRGSTGRWRASWSPWAGEPWCSTASGPWSGMPTTCAPSGPRSSRPPTWPKLPSRCSCERGVANRMVVVEDERQGKRLAPGFEALGWLAVHRVVMVSRSQPAAPEHRVEEISVAELRQARRELELAEPPRDADPADPALASGPARNPGRAGRPGGGRAALRGAGGRATGRLLQALFARRHRPGRAGHHPAGISKSRLRARHRLRRGGGVAGPG